MGYMCLSARWAESERQRDGEEIWGVGGGNVLIKKYMGILGKLHLCSGLQLG